MFETVTIHDLDTVSTDYASCAIGDYVRVITNEVLRGKALEFVREHRFSDVNFPLDFTIGDVVVAYAEAIFPYDGDLDMYLN